MVTIFKFEQYQRLHLVNKIGIISLCILTPFNFLPQVRFSFF